MESDVAEFSLPPAPRGLCFDRLDFVKTNFSVDLFLEDRQNNTSLEIIRDDLGAYLKVLRMAMIDLINKDYANFVNLSATLIGFDKSIEKIKSPLCHLREEILIVRQCIEEAMKELSMWLNQKHSLQKKKQLLKYYSQTMKSLASLDKLLKLISEKKKHDKVILADRGAMEYNQLKFSISKCESILTHDQKNKYKSIGEELTQILNELMFQYWNDNDEENLVKPLLTLALLGKVQETEILIRKKAIAPLLINIITESTLQKEKDGLEGLYRKILGLLDTKLKLLLVSTKHSKLAFFERKYSFLVNCFWCEVESRLEINLTSIFAPGNPKIFYKRYTESMQFVKNLEAYCDDKDTLVLLKNTAEFKSFQKRWNLPVYFQIRFQEIAGAFEACLQKQPTSITNSEFLLKETAQCWEALEQCWADGVYIAAIGHKFWKLSLQLLLRYATWCRSCCGHSSTPKSESNKIDKDLIRDSINIYVDSRRLLNKTPQLLQIVSQKIPVTSNILADSLRPCEEDILNIKEDVKKSVADQLYDNFDVLLRQVSDIPRLYRKTNRSIPTKPCTYVEVIVRTVVELHQDFSHKLDNSFLIDLYGALFNAMTESYYKYVEDVLTSVQKTEESLLRLKQIRERGPTQSSENAGVSDGDKIRLQLKVDVDAYEKLATTLKVEMNSILKFEDLRVMVYNAVKDIDIK